MGNTGTGIRLAGAGDAAAMAAIYAPSVTDSVVSFELVPPAADEMARRMDDVLPAYPWLVCERGAQAVGYAYASAHSVRAAYGWSVNATVYIDAGHHRQNIGRALYTSLFALLRLQGFYNAYGGITLPNAGSVGLHEAMGFALVGVYRDVGYKFSRWHDVGWWALALRDKPAAPPAPPLDLAAARAHPGWGEALRAGAGLVRWL